VTALPGSTTVPGLALACVLAITFAAGDARSATAYVSDDLVLGVYTEQNQQGTRLTTLHSGAKLETLSTGGEYTQVRLSDGSVGWVKSTYLTPREPATARVKQLEEELDRARATTPELAAAAASGEMTHLQQALAAKQAELDALKGAASAAPTPNTAAVRAPPNMSGIGIAAVLAATGGFGLGYVTLARRIRRKFGGLKVY
jgi:uncharacterized protein YgiM (DUF1202 family)